ncbi:Pentatricopeptide repeat-containing protein [Platanthera guangdongensis]|uniref:Pentatricopeptide repeat-containing protein n=1 Tax=Platanthera guangdongensis TaxID=2320717 RepID=A0ABR2MNS1_9ASPA
MGADIVVCNSIVGLYARCGSLEHSRTLFDEMPEKDGVTYNTMISGYMAYGFINQAMELFHQVPNPVLSTWNAVIGGLVQNNSFHHVLDLFQAMQNAGFRPNSVTISCVLPAISSHSSLLTVKQIHSYAVRNGCDRNVYVATALIDAYGKTGFLDGARRVFDASGAGSTSVIIWTAIISACSIRGNSDSAVSIFRRMVGRGIEPDPVTFTAVLSACAHSGEVDEARRILNVSMPEFRVSPEAEQYACVVGALSRKGMLSEAVELIDRMPFPPNSKAWGALLNGAAVHRDVAIGEHAFERLLEIEAENSGNYIVMANLYSQAGKWKEAQMVRKKMEEVGVGKVAGCSWIEGNGRLQVFISSDMANEHSRQAFELIDELVGLMREEGYTFAAKEELDEECCCC